MKEILNAATSVMDIWPTTDHQAIAEEVLEESPTFGFDVDNENLAGFDKSVWDESNGEE